MLEVKDATVAIGGKTLANGLSFIARDGELTCLTGAEGSGKTTLVRTLMGFLPVAEGFVSVDGELLTTASAHAFRTFMAYLPQRMQSLAHQLRPPEAPVCEAEEYGVWNGLLPAVTSEPEAEPLSPEDMFQLAERTICAADDRQIIIADEPTAFLTPELTQRMLALLLREVAKGKTVLVASRKREVIDRANLVIDLDALKQR